MTEITEAEMSVRVEVSRSYGASRRIAGQFDVIVPIRQPCPEPVVVDAMVILEWMDSLRSVFGCLPSVN